MRACSCRIACVVLAVCALAVRDGDAQRTISGRVTSTEGTRLRGIRVSALTWDERAGEWRTVTQAHTGVQGNYALSVSSGVYAIKFADTNRVVVWAHEFYDDAPVVDWAQQVEVRGADIRYIDGQLDRAGQIRGEVRDSLGHPLSGIRVSAWLGEGS